MTDQGKLIDFLNIHDPSPINNYSSSFVTLVVAATVIPLYTQKPKNLAKRNYWFFIGGGDTRFKILLDLTQIRRIINKKEPPDRLEEFKKITDNRSFQKNLVWKRVTSFTNDVFNNADTNNDGVITNEELLALLTSLSPPEGDDTPEPPKDLCNANERVSAGNCVPCDLVEDVLLTRAAGDDPNTGVDTSCEGLEIVILNTATENNFKSSNISYTYKDYNESWLMEYYLFIAGIVSSLFLYRTLIRNIADMFNLTDHKTPIMIIVDYLIIIILGFLLYYLDEDYRNPSEDAIHSNKYWQYLYFSIVILLTFVPFFRYIEDFSAPMIHNVRSLFKNNSVIIIVLFLAMLVIGVQSIYTFKPSILPGNSESFKLSPSNIEDTEEQKTIQDLIDEQTRLN